MNNGNSQSITEISVWYRFHAVGQGLFSEGWLCFASRDHSLEPLDYHWVYDCGTMTDQKLIDKAINRVKLETPVNHKIDLVIISHFDEDHINGIVRLLNELGTKSLMLPWAPLWHRLIIGFEQGLTAGDPFFLFYINPVQYLREQAGDNFEQFVFVPFSNGDGPPDLEEPIEPSPRPEGPVTLKIDADEVDFESFDKTNGTTRNLDESNADQAPKVKVMRERGTASILGLWEFVVYNDPLTKPKNKTAFAKEADRLRNELLSVDEAMRKHALIELKDFYSKQYTTPRKKNDISLFLYGGIIGFSNKITHSAIWTSDSFCTRLWCEKSQNASILYTGDGNLKTRKRWTSLAEHLGPKRYYRPTVFQVPHHGSKNNSFIGLASIIEPTVSVFSSDPLHKNHHPDPNIWIDFCPHTAIQVDSEHSMTGAISAAL